MGCEKDGEAVQSCWWVWGWEGRLGGGGGERNCVSERAGDAGWGFCVKKPPDDAAPGDMSSRRAETSQIHPICARESAI